MTEWAGWFCFNGRHIITDPSVLMELTKTGDVTLAFCPEHPTRGTTDMTENSRPRGVEGVIMPEEIGGPAPLGRYALFTRPSDGEMRMVHYEGVAYKVTDEKPWVWTDYISNVPEWSPADLQTYVEVYIADLETVDLADWVRTFGSRLESNFYQVYSWYNAD